MNRENIKMKVVEFLKEIDPITEINEGTNLLEDDVLDSMSILFLLSAIYNEIGVEIPMSEVCEENFSTVEEITVLVEKNIKK